MVYKVQSEDSKTSIELANGAKISFNVRAARRRTQWEIPLVCVFYEGPAPEREMDYLEMSLFVLDDIPMVGDVAIDSVEQPDMQFLNLPDETNAALRGVLKPAFDEFRERNRQRLIDLAFGSRYTKQTGPAHASNAPVDLKHRRAAVKGRRKLEKRPEEIDTRLRKGFVTRRA